MKNILVYGAGTVGMPLANHPRFEVVARKDYRPAMLEDASALVNCAGIAGMQACKDAGFDAVMQANVALPIELARQCRIAGIPLIQLSTAGVYRQQTAPYETHGEYAHIGDATYPHNLYCASKLLMEQQLADRAILIRLPWLWDRERFKRLATNWAYIQDTWASYFHIDGLQTAVLFAVDRKHPFGLYQVSSGVCYFPEFVKQLLGRNIDIRQTHAPDMTSAIPIKPTL